MRLIRPNTIVPTMMTACNVPEDDAAAWVITTAYEVGAQVIDDHAVYEALQSNTGAKPADNIGGESPKWLDLGPTNRWKMFDTKVGSRTKQADTITLSVAPGLIDSIAFLDVAATSIEVVMTDPGEGVVYTETIDLITKSVVTDGYTYFFEPIVTADAAVLLGIPPYGSATISITINNPTGLAEIGTIALGLQKYLGETQHGATFEIVDYSVKTEDAFGNFTILERSYRRRNTFELVINNASFDDINRTLAGYRAKLIVWVGTDAGYSSFITYGFPQSFSTVAEWPTHSIISLAITGLS